MTGCPCSVSLRDVEAAGLSHRAAVHEILNPLKFNVSSLSNITKISHLIRHTVFFLTLAYSLNRKANDSFRSHVSKVTHDFQC